MKLPNAERAIIPKRKVVEYLLSEKHRDGRAKAKFFMSFGFEVETWELLVDALKLHALENDVAEIETSPFGMRYIIVGKLNAPDGRSPHVKAVWFLEADEDTRRLATAYPLRRRTK